jgi:hypothetical protein
MSRSSTASDRRWALPTLAEASTAIVRSTYTAPSMPRLRTSCTPSTSGTASAASRIFWGSRRAESARIPTAWRTIVQPVQATKASTPRATTPSARRTPSQLSARLLSTAAVTKTSDRVCLASANSSALPSLWPHERSTRVTTRLTASVATITAAASTPTCGGAPSTIAFHAMRPNSSTPMPIITPMARAASASNFWWP